LNYCYYYLFGYIFCVKSTCDKDILEEDSDEESSSVDSSPTTAGDADHECTHIDAATVTAQLGELASRLFNVAALAPSEADAADDQTMKDKTCASKVDVGSDNDNESCSSAKGRISVLGKSISSALSMNFQFLQRRRGAITSASVANSPKPKTHFNIAIGHNSISKVAPTENDCETVSIKRDDLFFDGRDSDNVCNSSRHGDLANIPQSAKSNTDRNGIAKLEVNIANIHKEVRLADKINIMFSPR
jgi:hypothetical protein